MIAQAESLVVVWQPWPWPWLAVALAGAALGWEWLRWTFLAGERSGGRRVVAGLLVAAPLAVAAWALPGRSALWSVPVLGACAAAWAVRSYARTTTALARPVKALLLFLRLAVVLVLMLLLLRPRIERTVRHPVRQALAILVDSSRSMATPDATAKGPARIARTEAVRAALAAQADRLDSLRRHYDLRLAAFDANLREAAELDWSADGEATAIGDNLQRMIDACLSDGADLAGMVLLSDGNNNTADLIEPLAQSEHLASRGISFWAVGVGSERADDVASLNVRRLTAPDTADALDRIGVSAEIETAGLAGQAVEVECRLDEQIVGRQTVTFPADAAPQAAQAVQFAVVPRRPGFHRLTVAARPPALPGRRLVGEFAASRLIHVLGRQVRVLYIEGRQRFESKFIAQALAADPRFKVDRWLLAGPLAAAGLGVDADDPWAGYHVVLLGDCPASYFTPAALEALRAAVERHGAAVAMVGGRDSFADGGWRDTPLAAALPVDMRDAGQVDRPIIAAATEAALASVLMDRQDPPDEAAAWESLFADRPLSGASRMGSPKPAATVLLFERDSPDRLPLAVAQQYGAGRSMAIAFDTSWQWALSPDDTAGLHGRFWRQVVYWLADPTPNAWVATDRAAYDERRLADGAAVIEVTAGVEDAAGRPADAPAMQVSLIDAAGLQTPVALRADGNLWRGQLAALPGGAYTLRLVADLDGEPLTAEHRFEVARRDLESAEATANLALLRRMGSAAAAAGGGYRPLSGLEEVLESFSPTSPSASARPRPVRTEVRISRLADDNRWALLAGLLAMLTAEWMTRKRAGLV